MAIPDEGIGQDAIARWIPSEQLANGVRGFERLDGRSFGKKDVRKYELQKLAILAATRLYKREAAVGNSFTARLPSWSHRWPRKRRGN